VRRVFALYGYRNLRVPIVEQTPLFVRAIGAVTDVVEKEMYTFDDRLSGESLTLRPEATAHRARRDRAQPVLRATAAGVARRADVPPRAPAEGPLPPVPPVRRRGAGLPRTGRRRRADDPARALWREPRARRLDPPVDQLDRRRRRAACAPRGARRVLRAPRGRAGRGFAAAPAHQPAAHPRQQERIVARGDRRGAEAPRPAWPESRAHFEGLQACSRKPGIAFAVDPAAPCAPRLLQPHRLRVGHRPAGCARHRGRRRPLRRPVRRARRQGDAGRAASAWASSA